MNEKTFLVILAIISVVVFGATSFFQEKDQVVEDSLPELAMGKNFANEGSTLNPLRFSGQQQDLGAVTLWVEPVVVVPAEKIVFQVSMDTHSVNLEYDFTQVMSLTDSLEIKYAATEWDGGRGGHHLSGRLVFKPIGEQELLAKNINQQLVADLYSMNLDVQGVDEQSAFFVWD